MAGNEAARSDTTSNVTLRVFRGNADGGAEQEYSVPTFPGMVVLDAIHHIQANQDTTLSCRWNCKAGKCGSCSAEINGKPRLLCKARIRDYTDGSEPITVHPIKSFPLIKDLVTDVSWNYRVSAAISPFTPAPDAFVQPFADEAAAPDADGFGQHGCTVGKLENVIGELQAAHEVAITGEVEQGRCFAIDAEYETGEVAQIAVVEAEAFIARDVAVLLAEEKDVTFLEYKLPCQCCHSYLQD